MSINLPHIVEVGTIASANVDPAFAHRFPRLIEKLIRASLQVPPTSIRFPSFDAGTVHGYDGTLICVGADPYVPSGESIFEFKTSDRPRPDAEADYKKRKGNVPAHRAKDITFVYVTSKVWPGKGQDVTEWAAIKKREGHFKDVRVIDAPQLASWIQEHPAVGLYAARHIFDSVEPLFDGQLIDEYADNFDAYYDPILPPSVILAGRENVAKEIRDNGFALGKITTLVADNETEAAAFACRALLSTADENTQKERLASSIVLTDAISAAAMRDGRGLTLILTQDASEHAVRLKARNAIVVCRVHGETADSDKKVLLFPTRDEFVDALTSDSIDRDQANDLAAKSGRSLTVLRRAIGIGASVPDWAKGEIPDQQYVRGALLAGAWSESHPADKKLLEGLTGETYPNLFRRLRNLSLEKDPLIANIERTWAIRAPVDAITWLGRFLAEDDFNRFRNAIHTVFDAEKDNVPDPDVIFDSQSASGFSARLCTGLAQNILVLSALGDVIGVLAPDGMTCKDFASELVSSLPNLNAHPGFLAAFGTQLPYIAEAAPDAFINALEPLLEGDQNQLKWLLTPLETRFGLFPHDNSHWLIWALLTLAWIPEHFARVSMVLARMAVAAFEIEKDVGSQTLEALQSLFVSWSPQTTAETNDRICVLKEIVRQEPSIAFPLLEGLLPGGHSSVTVNERPRFAELQNNPLTWADVWKSEAAVVDMILPILDGNPQRIMVIIQHLHEMKDEPFTDAIEAMKNEVQNLNADDAAKVWEAIRSEVARHERFKKSDWAMSDERMELVKTLLNSFAPETDNTRRFEFLFNEDHPDVGDLSYQESFEEISRLRRQVIEPFVENHDIAGLVDFSTRVALPHTISQTLVDLRMSLHFAGDLMLAGSPEFIECIARAAYKIHGTDWVRFALLSKETSLPPHLEQITIASLIPDHALIDFLPQLNEELQNFYWTNGPIALWSLDEGDKESAIRLWSKHDRDLELVGNLSFKPDTVPDLLLLEITQKAVAVLVESPDAARSFNLHSFERLLSSLDQRKNVTLEQVAQLEWPLVPVLYLRDHRNLAIHRLIATKPDEFCWMLETAYRGEKEPAKELPENEKAIASVANKVLFTLNSSPYLDRPINFESLRSWIDESLKLADAAGRGKIARIYIGHVLAGAPGDEIDGLWPDRQIRDLLQDLSDTEIERGIQTQRFNQRGVHSDSVKFYAEHAAAARKAAAQMNDWPRVKAMLMRIAESDQRSFDRALSERNARENDNSL